MKYIKHCIIIAAGLGSRLGLDTPKCLVKIAGKSIIEHQLALLTNVEDVRMVVGFKAMEVMDHVRSIRPDVTFIHNSDFATTSTSYSLYLGSRYLSEPFLYIVGDIIISPQDFYFFMEHCCRINDTCLGFSKATTEKPIYIHTADGNVTHFSMDKKSDYEWCGLAYLKDIKIGSNANYIFQKLEKYLPLRCLEIATCEIDTPADKKLAEGSLKKLGII